MKLIVSGKTKEFTPQIQEKFSAKLAKLSKFVERRGEREAHVTHHMERHLHKVELIVNFYDHSLVGEGSDADLDTALCGAVEKLEKQAVKLRAKWRDTHRDVKHVRSDKETFGGTTAAAAPKAEPAKPVKANKKENNSRGVAPRPKLFRVNYDEDRKPMTLEEATMEMESGANYVVYRDSDRDRLSMLVRRPDGHLDLIES
ncbi:MAG TPA: ribosome-associated translation inhibitor RaiA [Bryobacteraceae bacterium]|nr:ribosome-associated translation inhibitor RaiA [Bryobacteraceae bacterium]